MQYKKDGKMLVDQGLHLETPVPARLRVSFTVDSAYYDFAVPEGWVNAFGMKEQWQWQGQWWFALTSVGKSGITKIDNVKITLPKQEYGAATLYWNRHPEPKILFHPEALGYEQAQTADTSYFFKKLPKGREIKFIVTADDSVGNRSASSDTARKVIK